MFNALGLAGWRQGLVNVSSTAAMTKEAYGVEFDRAMQRVVKWLK